MRVLYATDSGQAAEAGGKLLERIGRRDGIEVTVLSVSDLKAIDVPAQFKDAGPIEKSRARAATVVESAVERLLMAGFSVTGRVAEGNPAAEILKLLDHDPHDVTLVGAGNKTWLGKLLHGSTSTHVLHSSPTAVIVVHQLIANEPLRVLIAEDGSESARSAREVFVRIAEPDRCRVTVMSVVTPLDLALIPELAELDPASIPTDHVEAFELEKARIADGRERARSAADLMGEVDFAAEAKAVVGHPAEVRRHGPAVLIARNTS